MKKRVLVVDDEPDVVAALIFRLDQEGFEVLTACNGLEALELVRSQELDLVLLDVMMPGPNGYRVCKSIREEEESRGMRRTPIILLTARDLRGDVEREQMFMDFSDADEVIYKPYELEQVVGRVQTLCEAQENQETSDGSPVVLVVDDETAVRNLVCSILRSDGYEVLDAENGNRALEIVKRHGAKIDLLLSDVLMPGMNGQDLVKNLEAVSPLVRVVLMSGYSEEAIADRGILSDCHPVLRKPFSAQELLLEVEASLGGAK